MPDAVSVEKRVKGEICILGDYEGNLGSLDIADHVSYDTRGVGIVKAIDENDQHRKSFRGSASQVDFENQLRRFQLTKLRRFQNPEGLPHKKQKQLSHTKFADRNTAAIVHSWYPKTRLA